MSRRKGTPCACESDPCGCGSSKGKCIRAINNVSPDPNGDLILSAGSGIAISQTGDNEITIVNDAIASSFVAGDNIEINPSGDDLEIRLTDNPVINGTLQVNGDIIQQGAAYETHAEKVYTTNDYIYMRDGAITGLGAGDYAGFQVKKYDGTNDGRLVIDNTGTARVGDVGDEQPLLTREESANLNNGALLKWDGVNAKAVDEGTVGSDTKPIKIVNGVATPVTNDLGIVNSLIYGATAPITCPTGQYTALVTHTITESGNYLLNGFVQVNDVGTPGSDTYAIGFKVNNVVFERFTGTFWTASYSRSTITGVSTLYAGDVVSMVVTPGSSPRACEGAFSIVRLQ